VPRPCAFCKGGAVHSNNPFQLDRRPLIDSHSSFLAESVAAEAAPSPLLGFTHEPALHRIVVHVAQLLNPLVLAPDIEIVEARLPEMQVFELLPQQALSGDAAASALSQYPAGKALLQYLQDRGGRAHLRFADEQMKTFGHDHVTDHHKAVVLASLLQDFEEKIAAARTRQPRTSAVTTASDKVQVASAIIALETPGHERSLASAEQMSRLPVTEWR
jgi:hypothetical protein